jgi:dinuclear metal center YbgI/SA1388 family protein
MLAISALETAPAQLMKPAKSQQPNTAKGVPSSTDMGTIFLKTPEPTITLNTKSVAPRRPMVFCNDVINRWLIACDLLVKKDSHYSFQIGHLISTHLSANFVGHFSPPPCAMISVREVTQFLEKIAPPSLQESYDNCGLLVGQSTQEVSGVLISLDCTEDIVDEALARGCNLVVAHHPIVFKGLKKFNAKNYVERTVMKAIKHDVALYAIHTNLDHVSWGVNSKIAEKLHLQQVRILAPKSALLTKLVVFVPVDHTARVAEALFAAGAGQMGHYDACSFSSTGVGTFRPDAQAQPFVGQAGVVERVSEDRLEVVFPTHLSGGVVAALHQNHPYEVPAFDLYALQNTFDEVGAGAVGQLPESLEGTDFLRYLQEKMNLQVIRHTALPDRPIRRVAVCGGAGSFLLGEALAQQADAFVTADYKYHEFFDAEKRLVICDIGHYESEVYTKDLLYDFLSKKFPNFAVFKSEINTNPIRYFY